MTEDYEDAGDWTPTSGMFPRLPPEALVYDTGKADQGDDTMNRRCQEFRIVENLTPVCSGVSDYRKLLRTPLGVSDYRKLRGPCQVHQVLGDLLFWEHGCQIWYLYDFRFIDSRILTYTYSYYLWLSAEFPPEGSK